MDQKKGLFKYFTLNRFIKNTLILIACLYFAQVVSVLVFGEPADEIKSLNNLLATLLTSLLVGFIMTIFRQRSDKS